LTIKSKAIILQTGLMKIIISIIISKPDSARFGRFLIPRLI
jgi:hypothetical protein